MAHEDPATEGAVAGPARPRWITWVGFAGAAVLILALDLWTKQLALTHLSDGSFRRILGGAVYFDLTRNSGAAFSIGADFTVIFPIIAMGVLAGILLITRTVRSLPWAIALGLIFGGAAGNLSDRLFRAPGVLHGHVVDFISVFGPNGEAFPIFNVADSALFCGVVLAIALEFTGRHRDGTRVRGSDRAKP